MQKQADCQFEDTLGKDSETLSQKQNTNKRAGERVSVVEHLNPQYYKKKEKV
jgi:hypothetical protein